MPQQCQNSQNHVNDAITHESIHLFTGQKPMDIRAYERLVREINFMALFEAV